MNIMKNFGFVIKKDGIKRYVRITSKHIEGAVRKLYQEYDFDEIISIDYI